MVRYYVNISKNIVIQRRLFSVKKQIDEKLEQAPTSKGKFFNIIKIYLNI